MSKEKKGGASAPPAIETASIIDESTVRSLFPLMAARFEFYRLQYEETSNPLLAWRVVQEYAGLAKHYRLPVSFPPWCADYLAQVSFALGQLSAPSSLDNPAPAVSPQKARTSVAEALGLVRRGRSHFHASAREMFEDDIGIRAQRLRDQGFSETQTVEALAVFYEKDERTIREHVSRFRKKRKKIAKLIQSATRRQEKT